MNAALWVAQTGLEAQQTRMAVVSQNLANVVIQAGNLVIVQGQVFPCLGDIRKIGWHDRVSRIVRRIDRTRFVRSMGVDGRQPEKKRLFRRPTV